MSNLGRRVPTDWQHVERYRLSALISDPAHQLVVPAQTERGLGLPWYWRSWDQGQEGACVGYGTSAMMGITNTRQSHRVEVKPSLHRYEPRWLYDQAQAVDDWLDTPPEEGTSVRASCDVLRTVGHRRIYRGRIREASLNQGISANRWATTVDEIRAAIYADLAVSIGVNWYSAFDDAEMVSNERWVGRDSLGWIRGGHCVCIYRMSDRRQAFAFMNSWGAYYPPTWIPYATMQRLLDEEGEAVVIVDR